MKKYIQLSILILAILFAIFVPVKSWIDLDKQKSEADDINELFKKIAPEIPPSTKLSFTSLESGMDRIILFDYALLSLAPIVITDDHQKNDTLVALDNVHKYRSSLYNNYTCLKKARDNKFMVQLLVKKK